MKKVTTTDLILAILLHLKHGATMGHDKEAYVFVNMGDDEAIPDEYYEEEALAVIHSLADIETTTGQSIEYEVTHQDREIDIDITRCPDRITLPGAEKTIERQFRRVWTIYYK